MENSLIPDAASGHASDQGRYRFRSDLGNQAIAAGDTADADIAKMLSSSGQIITRPDA